MEGAVLSSFNDPQTAAFFIAFLIAFPVKPVTDEKQAGSNKRNSIFPGKTLLSYITQTRQDKAPCKQKKYRI